MQWYEDIKEFNIALLRQIAEKVFLCWLLHSEWVDDAPESAFHVGEIYN